MNFDILIIGNGILGLSTALAIGMENPSIKIGIVGPSTMRGSASAAAGAMLGCFGEVTDSTFKSKYGLEKLALANEAKHAWPKWLQKINSLLPNDEQISAGSGTFIILNSNSGALDDRNYAAIIKALEIYGEDHEHVDPRDIPGMQPEENKRPLRSLFIPSEGFINSSNLLNALNKAIASLNIKFIDDTVTKINVSFSRVRSVETKSQLTIEANRILISAGAYSQHLLDQIPPLQFRIPRILFGAGSSLLLNQPESHGFTHVVRTPNRAGSCGAHVVPYNNHTLYVGASNNVRPDERIHPKCRDIYYLTERCLDQFNVNLQKAEMLKFQTGNRPVTIDSYPLIGQTSIENLYLLTGTYRDGIHDSPILASYMANCMLDQPSDYQNAFSPIREPIHTRTKVEAIEEFVQHFISAAYEHSLQLPKIGWNETFKELWKNKAESLYEKLEINSGLFPDLLIMLEQEPNTLIEMKRYFQNLYAYINSKKTNNVRSLTSIKIAS